MESVKAEATQTIRLSPAAPEIVIEKSKKLWRRLHELDSPSEKGRLPDWAYLAISEIRAALGEEFERVFSSSPDHLVLRIGVPEQNVPAELRVTFEQPGNWHAEARESAAIEPGDSLLEVKERKNAHQVDALSKAKLGLERIKAIQI